jgi:hypothetical protein
MVRLILHSFDLRNLGRCPTCMRISFASMIASWLLTLSAVALGWQSTAFIILLAVAFSLVWLAHIVRRATLDISHNEPVELGRRLALRSTARNVMGAIFGAAALSVSFSSSVRADSGCGGWAGNNQCTNYCSNESGGPTRCQRQTANCSCYYCRSCGSGCSGNC